MQREQVAIVTGAGRGIGRAIATALGKEGYQVIVNYNGSQEAANQTKEAIEAAGGKAEIYQCNIADYKACEAMIQHVTETYGGIDVLVNNAGINKDGLVMNMKEEAFDAVIDTNLKGAFHCIRFVLRSMIKQRSGRIINISSVSGVLGNAGQANYAASKAGILGLTKSVAREVAKRNITVNAIAPGFIETDMTNALSDSVKEAAKQSIPVGTFGTPEDIANAAVFLASKQASYITGQVLCVDGGMAM